MQAITVFLLGLFSAFAGHAAVVLQEDLVNQPMLDKPRPAMTGADVRSEALKQALVALEAGRVEEARKLAESQIATNPGSAPAFEVLGTALALQDRRAEARKALERAVQLNPLQWTALMKLGDLDLAEGDRAAAEKRFAAVAKLQGDDPQLQQRLGLMAFYANRFDQAMTHFQKGIASLAPDTVSVKPNLAFIYNQRGQYRQTLDLFRDMPLAKVRDGEAYIAVATAMLGMEQLDEARKLLAEARAQLPKHPGLWLLSGRVARRAGQPAEASAMLAETLRLAPGNRLAAVELSLAEAASGRVQAGVDRMESLAKTNPKDVRVSLGMAQIQTMAGRLDKSAELYRGLLDQPGVRRFAALGLAQLLSQQGKVSEAEMVLRSGLNKDPADVEMLQQLGSTLAAQGNYKVAVRSYQQALALDPTRTQVLRLLSLAQSRAGDRSGALKSAEQLVSLLPQDSSALLLLGMQQEGGGRPADAVSTYQRLLAQDGKNLVAMNNLSLLLLERKQHKEALQLATDLVALAPEEPEVLDSAGWVYWRAGRASESRVLFEKAVKMPSAGPNVWYHYAVLLSESGEKALAARAAENALRLNKTFKYASEAKKLIQQK